MGSKIDRTGEENVNNFGSRMVIVRYRMRRDVDVHFPEYNWTAKNKEYKDFKKGTIKCPYEPRVCNYGYIGEGEYNTSKNGKVTKCYDTWQHMLKRCYSEREHKKYPTYKDCKVCDEWLCFQNFAKWFDDNYYEVKGDEMCLDKDIINKGNTIYSPKNCIFVPERINTLFTKRDKLRGDYPIGVTYHKPSGKFESRCNIYDYKENKNKIIYLGLYDTPEKAFKVYKEFKENYIREVADHYNGKIPYKLYNVMYKYQVEIND